MEIKTNRLVNTRENTEMEPYEHQLIFNGDTEGQQEEGCLEMAFQ